MTALSAPTLDGMLAGLPVDTTRIGTTPDEQASGVARIVGGIVSYARWPEPRTGITICTMGATRFARQLGDSENVIRLPVAVHEIAPGSAAAQQRCDVLYLGSVAPALQQRAIMAIHGQPVLSIAEADPACHSGAMFCLLVNGDTLAFRLSIDAVSRSTIRVDPRVLQMFSDGAKAS